MIQTAVTAWATWLVQLWNYIATNWLLCAGIYLVLINGIIYMFDKIKKLIK